MKDQREKQSWTLTAFEEAHGNMLIKSDLPSMCRDIFSHCCVLWGENKTVKPVT